MQGEKLGTLEQSCDANVANIPYLSIKIAKMVLCGVLESHVLCALRVVDPVEVAGHKVGSGIQVLLDHHLPCDTHHQH